MSIRELLLKIKDIDGLVDKRGLYTACVFVCIGLISFSFGIFMQRAQSRESVSIEMRPIIMEAPKQASATSAVPSGTYVASKNGTKYHLASCPGAKSISDANKVWFETKEAAEAAGYTPASNCPGL